MFPGFNRRKKGSISNGDWDRDGVKNRKDCEPLNFRRRGPEHRKYKCAAFDACGSYVENPGDFCEECEEDAFELGLI